MQLITASMHFNNEPGVVCHSYIYAIQTKCGAVLGMIFIAGTSNMSLPPGLWISYKPYQAALEFYLPVWKNELGLPDPDMIVINQNLWELGR